MKVINWNICCLKGKIEQKLDFLKNLVLGDSFIVVMQEVKTTDLEFVRTAFIDHAQVEYSLEYRKPGKYDTDSRKLGVAILVSNDISIQKAGVLNRALMPDRTLVVDLLVGGQPLRVFGLHSITGCDHRKAKELQFFSFAEAIDEYRPDIVAIDANEPEHDHYDIEKMKFFDNRNKGNGCRTFFKTMLQNGMVDSFAKDYDRNLFIEGQCLQTSHIIKRGGRHVRYDFLFVNHERFKNYQCSYDLNGSIAAGSDHSIVLLEPKSH